MKPLDHLRERKSKEQRQRYPNVPEYALKTPKYTDKTANGLTKCIIDYLTLEGWQAERINTMGRMIDNRKQVTDVIGRTKIIGSTKYIPTTGTKGSADISATIKGRSVKIEIKIGYDMQSQDQKRYQESIESSGGIYWIAKSFDQFYELYQEYLESN
jgi:hypothetical protein